MKGACCHTSLVVHHGGHVATRPANTLVAFRPPLGAALLEAGPCRARSARVCYRAWRSRSSIRTQWCGPGAASAARIMHSTQRGQGAARISADSMGGLAQRMRTGQQSRDLALEEGPALGAPLVLLYFIVLEREKDGRPCRGSQVTTMSSEVTTMSYGPCRPWPCVDCARTGGGRAETSTESTTGT